MTHAELLRSHADLATKEGGVYYSGEYLSRIAATAESLEHEYTRLLDDNARLQEVVTDGELHAREILGENAKLHQQLVDVTVSMGRVEERCAKLRELVRDVWHLFTEHGAVHPYDLPKVDAVRDRMHELEVEVES